ncbi:MAG: 2-amino-4-hydroxy-6-hydroxymethyldihydropteridine diphosphokinase [Deltaproteobacteria bacterium]|nr:2-amino-4-hydroxy-6-hydroxymethyldihydropteridine diphosphokinase [Deltaproteobacteria bacterium]
MTDETGDTTPKSRPFRLAPQHAYIALGANLGSPNKKLIDTIDAIDQRIGRVIRVSSFYLTTPLTEGPAEEGSYPNYVNAVIICASPYTPEDTFHRLMQVEKEMGRTRSSGKKRWEARIIDIDLLAMGERGISSKQLTLPHPCIASRDFVLYPLREIEPAFVHPVTLKSVDQMIFEYHARGLPLRIISRAEPLSLPGFIRSSEDIFPETFH